MHGCSVDMHCAIFDELLVYSQDNQMLRGGVGADNVAARNTRSKLMELRRWMETPQGHHGPAMAHPKPTQATL